MTHLKHWMYRLYFALFMGQLLLATKPVAAQSQDLPMFATLHTMKCMTLDDGGSYYLAEARQLAHAIPEQASKAPNEGVFHLDSIFTPPLADGQRMLLSGTDTGSGFVTDDVLTLDVIPGDLSHSWDFRSSDWMRIIPVPVPADITDLFLPGRYHMVTVTMTDLLMPFYRSSDLWLLTYSPCNWLVATPTVTRTLLLTAVPVTPTAVASATLMPAVAMTNTRSPATVTATATDAAAVSRQIGAKGDTQNNHPYRSIQIWLLSLLLISTMIAAYATMVMKQHFVLPSWQSCRTPGAALLLKIRAKWQAVKSDIEKQMKE